MASTGRLATAQSASSESATKRRQNVAISIAAEVNVSGTGSTRRPICHRSVFLRAQRVGASGKTYGLDMTDEMLELARSNAAEAGVANVEFLKGVMEDIPLADATVDVVLSNCVINLSPDKAQVLREAARVLRPGGRLAFTDIVADPDMDDATRRDLQQWTGCIAGALTAGAFDETLTAAGFTEIEVRETHRVPAHAGSAIVRARKPG